MADTRRDDPSRTRPVAPSGRATRSISSTPERGAPSEEPAGPFGDDGWRALVRPVRNGRQGTMPAGLVMIVVVAALVITMFMNSEATLRKAEGERGNAEWHLAVARGVAAIGSGLGLTAPRNAVDAALGRTATGGGDNLDELLAAKGGPPVTAGDEASAAGGDTPTVTAPPEPQLRVPTAAAPLKMWVGGDSLSNDFGVALSRIATNSGLFSVTQDSRVSTGLSRPDYFNWPQHLVSNVIPAYDPDVVVFQIGSNDAQNIPLEGGGLVAGSPEWLAEYRDRVGKTMDLLASETNDRLVVWVGTPIMGPNSGVGYQDALNHIYASEAAKRPWVRYFDTWPFFAGPDGQYAPALTFADGSNQQVRARDNIHFNLAGANRLGWAVWSALNGPVDLSANFLRPPAEQGAPADVAERAEVPPPGG